MENYTVTEANRRWRRVLGLDLGVGSIGWALIDISEDEKMPVSIVDMGVHIVNLSKLDNANFKSNDPSPCANRTSKRAARRCLDRYHQRRYGLRRQLGLIGLTPSDDLKNLDTAATWNLRAKAATEGCRLEPAEIGRVLMMLNQRRGYKSSRADRSENSDSKYLAKFSARYSEAKSQDFTVGQYFAATINDSACKTGNGKVYTYRVKNKVFPRQAYEEEFDAIMKAQAPFYPQILTEENIARLKYIIFHKRPLKSCKHLVSTCEFEKKTVVAADGKKYTSGPKVAPRTSPLAQLCKVWESVNNIEFRPIVRKSASGGADPIVLTAADRLMMVEYLNNNEKLTSEKVYEKFSHVNKDKYSLAESLGKGLQGNTTICALRKALADEPNVEQLLKFQLSTVATGEVNEETGEELTVIDNDSMMKQPLFKLWHAIYSIDNPDELKRTLRKNFGIENEETLQRLLAIDFKTDGFSNRSSRFMRRLLPQLQLGLKYSEACEAIGVRHSDYRTLEENATRRLAERLTYLKTGSLRQPVVEKILNQMISVVNNLIDRYGDIDEAHVELARELRQTKQQRLKTIAENNKNEAARKKFAEEIAKYTVPTRSTIQKYALWVESENSCIYCGKPIGIDELLKGDAAEREHIIPRSVFFDDSFSNKACSCRECNKAKGALTGYEWMSRQSDEMFAAYLSRVERLFKAKRISKTKYRRLMTPQAEIPTDFLNRDLTLSQYIARKAYEILSESIRTVTATSGTVTALLRHLWGYDDILHDLCLPRYKEAGLTETVEVNRGGQILKVERIIGWSKRMDHRHHAIDALTVALTRQRYVNRLNNLSSERERMYTELTEADPGYSRKNDLVRDWCARRPHFSVRQVLEKVSNIAVSTNNGKEAVSWKKQSAKSVSVSCKETLIPRGPLTEETVYGKIKVIVPDMKIEDAVKTPSLVISPYVREQLQARLDEMGGDVKRARKSLDKRPVFEKNNPSKRILTVAAYEECFVTRYSVESITSAKLKNVIDEAVAKAIERRIKECGSDAKFKSSLKDRPLTLDPDGVFEIKKVRCRTRLSEAGTAVIRRDASGQALAYAKKGSNHHIALYRDAQGQLRENVVSFWDAVMRVRYGLPAIIKNPAEVWQVVADRTEELPLELITNLPDASWSYWENLQVNQCFLLGLTDEQISDAMSRGDKRLLCEHLYRVQSISFRDYCFRLHTQAAVSTGQRAAADKAEEKVDLKSKMFMRLVSVGALKAVNPHKVRVDYGGNITLSE